MPSLPRSPTQATANRKVDRTLPTRCDSAWPNHRPARQQAVGGVGSGDAGRGRTGWGPGVTFRVRRSFSEVDALFRAMQFFG